jgi:propionyl-CoA carboxylase alpha chain
MIGPQGSAGFRLDRRSGKTPAQRVEFEPDVVVEYRAAGKNRIDARTNDGAFERVDFDVRGPVVALEVAGIRRTYRVTHDGAAFYVHSSEGERRLVEKPRLGEAGSEGTKGGLVAPMPGKIVAVRVAEGDAVAEGQPLVVLEAMKMEHTVVATHAGTVELVLVAVNDQVEAAALLVVLRE